MLSSWHVFGVQPHPERCFFRHLRPDWTRQPDGDPVYGDGKSVFESALRYVGHDLQRPECILAERDGTLWTADARGGVVRLCPDGSQEIITQKRSGHFADRSVD